MRSGKLRHSLTIRYKTGTTTTDVHGGEYPVWGDYATGVRAQKLPLAGRELVRAGAVQSEARVRFRMRYLSGLDSTMQIVEGGDTYEIVEPPIDINGLGRWHEVLCKSVSGA